MVVTAVMMITSAYERCEITFICKPISATISATSPRGVMPTPTFNMLRQPSR